MELKDIKSGTSDNSQKSNQSLSPKNSSRKVGFLLGVGIFFMPYFFSWFTLRNGHSQFSRVMAFGWLFLILVVKFQAGNKEQRSVSSVGQPTNYESINDSCRDVSRKFGASSKLSDVQKDELWKGYLDKKFKWQLKVVEVSNEMFGDGYTVQFKCKNSESFVSDVIMTYPASQKNLIMGLQKDSYYEVEGILKRFGAIIGLSADAI